MGSSLEWLPAGELHVSDVPGGGNPQPRYPLVATLGDEMGEIGVESVTPLRRGVARDPSIGNPALQGRGGVISGSGSLEKLKAIAEKAPIGGEGLREVGNALGFKPPTRLHAFLAYRMEQLGVEPR